MTLAHFTLGRHRSTMAVSNPDILSLVPRLVFFPPPGASGTGHRATGLGPSLSRIIAGSSKLGMCHCELHVPMPTRSRASVVPNRFYAYTAVAGEQLQAQPTHSRPREFYNGCVVVLLTGACAPFLETCVVRRALVADALSIHDHFARHCQGKHYDLTPVVTLGGSLVYSRVRVAVRRALGLPGPAETPVPERASYFCSELCVDLLHRAAWSCPNTVRHLDGSCASPNTLLGAVCPEGAPPPVSALLTHAQLQRLLPEAAP